MITSLRLQNFKCFEEQTLEIGPITLLSGLNGMGKSSVLQALLVLRQSYQQGLLPNTGLALNGDLIRLGTAQAVFYEDAQTDDVGLTVTWETSPPLALTFAYSRGTEADVLHINSDSLPASAFNHNLFQDQFHYLQAERLGPRLSYGMSDNLVRHHRQLGTAGEYAGHFLLEFGKEKIAHPALAHPSAPQTDDVRSQVQAWLSEVSPGVQLELQNYANMDAMQLRYGFITGQKRSNPYRATSVGFGLSYTLPILVAVLSSKPGALLLLENPEAHLHPQGQARIGGLLARAASIGIQIILETHSDHVLNGLRLAVHQGILSPDAVRLHFFERREMAGRVNSQVVSPKIDRHGRLDQWPDGFFDEWNKNLQALLKRK